MDLSDALAKFEVPGAIDSPGALDDAISNVLDALDATEADIVSLLTTLTYSTHGMLEVVLTSRSDTAFIFRSRIIKSLQKSSTTPHNIFIMCAERLGAMLVGLPPDEIVLDRTIMETYNAFTASLRALKSSDGESYTSKRTKTVVKPQPKPSGKKKQKHISVDLTIQIPSNDNDDDMPDSPLDTKSPSSPIMPMIVPSKKHNLPEQLRECFETFFGACAEEAIEDWAHKSLLNILKSTDANSQPCSPFISKARAPSSPLIEKAFIESPINSRFNISPYVALGPSDIARYLEDAASSKFGDWPVVVSQRGIKHLRHYAETDRDLFLRIEKKIKQLSVGFFSAANRNKLLDKDVGIPIYTADLGDDLRLIYHIDFGAPTGTVQESQFIRIFGVFSNPDIDSSFWKSVAAQLARRGPEYVQRCEERAESSVRSKGGKQIKTTPPKLFPPLDTSHWKQDGADVEIDESHFLELHRILALEKFVPLSHTFFDAIQKYDETSFMFAVSSPEYRIIKHPSSCLVLGRSGTGKTTCMLFRMISLDIAAEKYNRPFRQMFVTQSRTLARRVRSYCMQLRQTSANEVGTAARERAPGLSLLEMDENAEEDGVLPPKFSELRDSHFPLFLTYDQLCRLLEADCELHYNPSALTTASAFFNKETSVSIRQPLVSFDYFESQLWPHFDERIKKGLHAAQVYSEFMGVIKGSEDSLSKQRRFLDRKSYETLSSRTHSSDETERSRIYTLFEAYQKQRPSGSYDIGDRVHALMEALQTKGLKGQHVDFLYVDEAQDNLIVDAALLRSLCQNPHGLFFAGDTAQTISVGSAFRFSELKAFLYRLEVWPKRDDLNVKREIRRAIDPQFFQLSTNYRSHSGIVNVAAFVVGLLNQYFPHSIDALTPEVSLVDVSAHKPVFFSGREDGSDFRRLISDSKSGNVELGAHQVIIVRDEAAVKKLQTDIGRVAVILTLYESKGMEFDDVLLYDFFTDSAATATDWRAVLLSQNDGRTFDERKHSILQSELKSFYVGLTRARERVWIWDSSTKGQDMEALFVTYLLATAYETNQKVPQLGASSSPEEWAKQAQHYFSKKLFGEASFCFKKAGMDWWARVALAYGDRQVASRLPDKHPRRLAALDEVARTFDRLGPQVGASDDPKNARLLFINAAECFASIPNHSAAAQAFFKGHKYTEAAYHYRMAGMFDEAVDVVKTREVDPAVAASIEYAAKFVYARKHDVKSLHKAWRICESKEEFVEFLQDHGFEEQRVEFLDSITEHEESGDVFWKAGNFLDAIARYRRSKKHSAIMKSVECLLDGLRSNITLGSKIGKAEPIVTKLLSLGQQLSLNANQKAEVSLFQAIVSSRINDILKLGRSFFEQAESRGALLAFDTWIHAGSLKGLEVDAMAQVVDILLGCQNYCYVINVLVQRPELLKKPATLQLLGISSAIEQDAGERDMVADREVRPQSFIYREAAARNDPLLRGDTSASVVLPKDAVDDMVLRALLRRRNDVLMLVHRHALKSGAFEICSRFLATGRCTDFGGRRCWRGHIPSNAMTIDLFNSRFRLYLLIIAVLDQFAAVKDGFDADERNRPNMQRIWLSRIFDLCYPDDPRAGNLCDLIPALLPDYGTLMPTLKSWLQETYLGLRPSVQFRFFLSNILRISLLATWIDHDEAKAYLPTGLWFSDEQVAAGDELLQDDGRPIAGAALTWFARNTGARHNLGVYTIKHIVEHKVAVDVDVAASYIEEVCGQLILNHYMHYLSGSYDNMVMPRSWIIRALMRQSSYQANGSMPYILVPILGAFIEKLVGKRDAGKLQHRGQALWQSGPPIAAIVRICRCLALLGVNNQKLQKDVLLSLQGLKYLAAVHRTEFVRFSTAVEWTQVEEALHVSMVSSSLDDLVKVIMPPRRMVPSPSGQRYVFCSNDEELLRKLLIGTHIPLAAPLLLPKQPAKPRVPTKAAPASAVSKPEPPKGDEAPSANRSSEGTTQMEGIGYSEKHHMSASVIRRLFLRSRRRAGGPVAVAFEDLVKRLIGGQKQPSHLLLLCLRGPLPHVFNCLHALKDASQSKVASLNMAMKASKHEELDELHAQGLEIRYALLRQLQGCTLIISGCVQSRARNLTNKLIKDLQPTSEFYLKSTVPILDEIIKKVNLIPDLVEDVRKFASFPEDLDYELGVKAILRDKAPWALKKPTAKKERRPALNTQDLDGYDDY